MSLIEATCSHSRQIWLVSQVASERWSVSTIHCWWSDPIFMSRHHQHISTGSYGNDVVSNFIRCWRGFPTQKHDQWPQSPNNRSVKSRGRLCNSADCCLCCLLLHSCMDALLVFPLDVTSPMCDACKWHKRRFKFNASDCRNVFWMAFETTFKCDLDPTYKNLISKNDLCWQYEHSLNSLHGRGGWQLNWIKFTHTVHLGHFTNKRAPDHFQSNLI